MDVVTLLIAIVALVVAILAYQRTGGIHDLRRQVDALGEQSEEVAKSARTVTADMLDRLEGLVRGKEKSGDVKTQEEAEKMKEGE